MAKEYNVKVNENHYFTLEKEKRCSRYACKSWFIRPTQSLLQKWLREIHNIHIEINRTYEKGYYTYEYFIDKNNQLFGFKNFEEALEKGLLEGLKLIK